MDMLDIDASNRVKRAMKDADDTSVYRLSKVTGISRSTLERRLSGGSSFTISELGKIARALGRRLWDLFPSDGGPE